MSEVLAVPTDDGDASLPADPRFLDDLRRARRRRRVAEVHWVDALYRAYMAALFGIIGIALLGGAVGDEPLTPAQVADVRTHGPAVIGLAVSLVVAIGLRSGSRGGPLAVEPGDVRHVLLSAIDRSVALRGPALRQLRTALFVALVAGAAVGRFAERRFAEAAWSWIASCAAAAAVTVALGLGAALVISGHRVSRPIATLVGGLLVAWSVADVATRATGSGQIPASPGRAVGWLALAPLDLHVAPLAAVAVAVVLVVLGLRAVGGTSIEAAERRTALVGQIRFAATLQDLRTVMVLRRQLAADQPRDRPWLPRGTGGHGSPVWRRGWTGLLRFPAGRLGRIALLVVIAGVALRVVWGGTAPVVILAGLAVWIIGLDLVEPLAQEVDHPSRRELYPVPAGALHVRLLGPSLVVGALVGALVGAVAILPGAGQVPTGPALVTGVAAGLSGVVGAVANVISSVPTQGDAAELAVIAPEVAGTRLALRALLPPLLATAGAAPLLMVEADLDAGRPMWANAPTLWAFVALAAGLVVGWVHQREDILRWWEEAQEAAKSSAGSRGGDDEDDDAHDEERRR